MLNKTIFQFFHWYFSMEDNLWNSCAGQADYLSALGVTDVWLPPAYKSAKGTDEPGYAVYDLFDLGEFNQKGTVRTKHGTKEEYINCVRRLNEKNIAVLADIVFNHRIGGDEKEKIWVTKFKEENRLEPASDKIQIEADTKFTFPGRKSKYSDYIWDAQSFTGVCEDGVPAMIHNEWTKEGWDLNLDDSQGNYDYLMGCDVEFRNPNVRDELVKWGIWYIDTTGVNGFRLDGLKHIPHTFFPEWLERIGKHFNRDFFTIGEFWKADVEALEKFIQLTNGQIQLFDVPLHFNLYNASIGGRNYDLRKIFDNTLVSKIPQLSITFVDNHDTQPLQSLQSMVEPWFKPHAYALILLWESGIPCVFHPALYSAVYKEKDEEGKEQEINIPRIELLDKMMKTRAQLAYGKQTAYFDDPNLIGWVRSGIAERENSGIAVLLTNKEESSKKMNLGKEHAGKIMVDLEGKFDDILLNEDGDGEFRVAAGYCSVWTFKDALR